MMTMFRMGAGLNDDNRKLFIGCVSLTRGSLFLPLFERCSGVVISRREILTWSTEKGAKSWIHAAKQRFALWWSIKTIRTIKNIHSATRCKVSNDKSVIVMKVFSINLKIIRNSFFKAHWQTVTYKHEQCKQSLSIHPIFYNLLQWY